MKRAILVSTIWLFTAVLDKKTGHDYLPELKKIFPSRCLTTTLRHGSQLA
jgi:hypothetical protein